MRFGHTEKKMITFELKNKSLPLRTIFWGYHLSGWNTYSYLKQSQAFKVIAIVLPSNRKHETIDRLRDDAMNSGIEIFNPDSLADAAFVHNIKKLRPDVYMVDSYSKLIPSQLLSLTKNLAFNLHPGLLPEYRGANVLNWSIINGEEKAGITLHVLSDRFDEGAVVSYREVAIGAMDDVNNLDLKMGKEISPLLIFLEEQIKKGRIIAEPQSGNPRYYKARKPEDGEIDTNAGINDAYNKIRALTYPWPGAYVVKNNKKIIIWQALPIDLSLDSARGLFIKRGEDIFLTGGDKKLLQIKCVNDPSQEAYAPIRGIGIVEALSKCGIEVIEYESIGKDIPKGVYSSRDRQ
jgi:methionyl-tRNA formyltransferase